MAKQRIRICLKTYDHKMLDNSARRILDAVSKYEAKIRGPIPMPTEIRKFCVLRAPHVNKKSREQFEMRTHKRLIDIEDPSPEIVDALMKLDLPSGVNIEIKL